MGYYLDTTMDYLLLVYNDTKEWILLDSIWSIPEAIPTNNTEDFVVFYIGENTPSEKIWKLMQKVFSVDDHQQLVLTIQIQEISVQQAFLNLLINKMEAREHVS